MTDNDKFVKLFLEKMKKLDARETDECIHCGKHITSMEKIGRCVYARPCGCRLWQGDIPKAWQAVKP